MNKEKLIVFLGGTCNGSLWRNVLEEHFKDNPYVYLFNPVVKDWNAEVQKKEIEIRQSCDIALYVITPKMKGIYSICEVVDDSDKRPDKSIFCVLNNDGDKDFDDTQIVSLNATKNLVKQNRGTVCEDLQDVIKEIERRIKMKRFFDNIGSIDIDKLFKDYGM